jgi:hypothetical protein
MGIRFHCPKGHKLNVKDFQAGRKAICPFCGEKTRVPRKSTRPSSKRQGEAEGEALAAEASELDAEAAAPKPFPPALGTSPASLTDPLAAGGDTVWYVRPVSGGQFGPATPDIMRSWLAEGRVGADSLVWREGWRDWQTAANVFPQFSPNQSNLVLDEVASDPVVAAAPASSALPSHRSRTRNTRIIVIGSLALVVVVLAVILIAMLPRQ